MKKSLLFFCFIVSFSFFSNAQDSLRVILCVYSGMDCYGFPTMDKTIEHIDSIGRVNEVNIFHIDGCNGAPGDSDFIHVSDMYYLYDSSSNVLTQTTVNYNGQDTLAIAETYTYDASQYLTTHITSQTYQQQTTEVFLDSIIYNQNHDIVYELVEAMNDNIQQLDTMRFQTTAYDTAGRDSFLFYQSYSNFSLIATECNYFYYDSLSNLITLITSISGSGFDSTRSLYQYDTSGFETEFIFQKWDTQTVSWDNNWRDTFEYDSLNLKTEDRHEVWDTLLTTWNGGWREIYQYDSLDSLTFIYHFNCSDSTCSDTMSRTVYVYDTAGHLITERHEDYDGFNSWFGTSGSETLYDVVNDTIEAGSWYYVEAGCDVSNTNYYTYNSDHQLVHTQYDHYGCLENLIDCDYFNLDSDSMLVLLSFPGTVCPFDTVHIPATVAGGVPPYTYQWSPMINMLDSDIVSPRIITDTTITYTLTVTDSVGHIHSSSATITVYAAAIRPVTVTSSGIPCVGNPFYISFNSDSLTGTWDFQWYRNSVPLFSNNDPLQIYLSGDYWVSISNEDCQLTSNTLQVNLNIPDTVHVTALGNTGLCQGQSVTLLADSFPFVKWNTGDSSYSIITDTAGNYFVIATDTNGCVDTSNTVSVIVHPLPSLYLGADTSICDHELLTLNAGNGISSYSWNDGTTLSAITVTSAGTYFLSVSDSFACGASDTIQVSVNSLPVIYIGPDTTICNDETLVLDAGNGFASYMWSDSSANETLSAFTTSIVDTNNYFVLVTDTNGCFNSDTIQVIFDICEGMITAQLNHFILSPNPAHTSFTLTGVWQMQDAQIEICNMAGVKILQVQIPEGEPLVISCEFIPPGIYFVKVRSRGWTGVQKMVVD